MLRPTLNTDYFHDLYDMATDFGIEVEGHRELRGTDCLLRGDQTVSS
jgi:glutamine synthetase